MIFIFPKWRFWNQVFQYMFAKHIATADKEKIVTTDAPYFWIIEESTGKFCIMKTGNFFRYVNFWLDKIFAILARLRIITWIHQILWSYWTFPWMIRWHSIKKWLLKNIKYIEWFFIYEDDHIIWKKLNINQELIGKAKKFLSSIPENYYRVFLHIRRWDYLEWSVFAQTDLSLPLNYYKQQIDFFQKKYKTVSFIFLSDDIEWCKKEFDYIENKVFSNNDLGTDFAIMKQCDGAIISPSTLSFLWAYFMKNKLEIFAPKYWLWFKDKIWYPEWMETKRFNFIDIH